MLDCPPQTARRRVSRRLARVVPYEQPLAARQGRGSQAAVILQSRLLDIAERGERLRAIRIVSRLEHPPYRHRWSREAESAHVQHTARSADPTSNLSISAPHFIPAQSSRRMLRSLPISPR